MSTRTSKGGIDVRHDNGIIDEVVATGVDVHLEYMSDRQVWVKIGDVAFTLTAEARPMRIQMSANPDSEHWDLEETAPPGGG